MFRCTIEELFEPRASGGRGLSKEEGQSKRQQPVVAASVWCYECLLLCWSPICCCCRRHRRRLVLWAQKSSTVRHFEAALKVPNTRNWNGSSIQCPQQVECQSKPPRLADLHRPPLSWAASPSSARVRHHCGAIECNWVGPNTLSQLDAQLQPFSTI